MLQKANEQGGSTEASNDGTQQDVSNERSRRDASGARTATRPDDGLGEKRSIDALKIDLRELSAGLGLEGLKALAIMFFSALVLAIGILAVIAKWPIWSVSLSGLIDWTGLPVFWIVFVVATAFAGWALSGQVSKKWLRIFVGVSAVVAGLLVVAVGRDDRVQAAKDAASTEAMQLKAIIATTEQLEQNDEELEVAKALVGCLEGLGAADTAEATCTEFGTEVSGADADNTSAAVGDDTDGDTDVAASQTLACLPGWTLDAFGSWVAEASFDRRVVSLTAVARCELDAFDPGSEVGEEAAPETADVAVVAPGVEGESTESTADPNASVEEQVEQQEQEQKQELQAIEDRVDQGAQAQAALGARAAVNEALSTQRTEMTLYEAIVDGSDGILETISRPTDFAEFRFSGATWILILGLALLWYRWLEIRAGRHNLGPVDIVSEGAAGGPDPADSGDDEDGGGPDGSAPSAGYAIFKQAVVQNVPEPGAVPGAQALAPVGDLVASSDVPRKQFIGSLIEVLQTIFATRSGFVVVFTSHVENDTQTGENPTPSNVVFVRLRDRRTGQQLASMRFTSEYLEEAAQLAGYWVAGWIISRSRYVPDWSKWSETDARSFYSLQWRQGDDLPLHMRGNLDPAAIDKSATNSLILAQRAYSYQISSGDKGPYTFNALEDFARAVNRRPRYPVARYRRAAALSALMNKDVNLDEVFHGSTDEEPYPSESRFRHLFQDLLECDGTDVETWMRDIYGDDPDRRGRFPEQMREAMLDKVGEWAAIGRAGVRAGRVARLRPSERRFWHDFSKTGASKTEARADWMKLIRTSDYIAEMRRSEPRMLDEDRWQKLEARADGPDSHWQISYNLACYYALKARRSGSPSNAADINNAFAWLERCLDRPHSGQLVREWAQCDPDLKALRDNDPKGWDQWIRRVPRLPIDIRFGDRNHIVEELQVWLNFLDPTTDLTNDGHFGTETADAIRRFQRERGLRVDGNADAKTVAEIEEAYLAHQERIRELLRRGESPIWSHPEVLDDSGRLDQGAVIAIRRFQSSCGLVDDGNPGPVTCALLFQGVKPEDVRELFEFCARSSRTGLRPAVRHLPVTSECFRTFQSAHGLKRDGVPGPKTLETLRRCRKAHKQGHQLRALIAHVLRPGSTNPR